MANKPIDLVGHKYGFLTVTAKVRMTRSGAIWECLCDCGSTCEKYTTQLRRRGAITQTCASLSCEWQARSIAKGVHHAAGREPLYRIWKGMRDRCGDLGNKYYGGKGVSICPDWDDYSAFREWANANGYRWIEGMPRHDRLTIDRIDSMRGYTIDNCEWVTGRENSRRTRRAA